MAPILSKITLSTKFGISILTTIQIFYISLFLPHYSEDDSDNDDDIFVNTNHPPPIEVQNTSSSDSDS